MANAVLNRVTQQIELRSQANRSAYLSRINAQRELGKSNQVGCSNLAHVTASMPEPDKRLMITAKNYNLGIVTSYNDMLSAHKPYENYPPYIRQTARKYGVTTQVAGATPAMCDGITQGREGMELSLFSRDIIAMSTAVGLSHDVFDAVILLGICDKIVPGLLIGALQFGHLPMLFIPAGPMESGLPNNEKKRIRQLFVEDKVDRGTFLKAEMQSYHSPGTCTFYGTANSNQLLLESMGLHRPNHAFINPKAGIRPHLTKDAVKHLIETMREDNPQSAIGELVTAKVLVNALVTLLASGGSTNHTIHWIAVAKAAGYTISWEDIAELSEATPLLCSVYPNGSADVNDFQDAGGPATLIQTLLDGDYLHDDVMTINGFGLHNQCQKPELSESNNILYSTATPSINHDVLRPFDQPFRNNGGICLVKGNLGRAIVKTSALEESELTVRAKAMVFNSQEAVIEAYENNLMNRPVVVVVRFQGPSYNGMPELHKLMPILGSIRAQGHAVALLTDGRLSGASGQVLAAIHLVTCEQQLLYKIVEGDDITIDCATNQLTLHGEEKSLAQREMASPPATSNGFTKVLFDNFRNTVSEADKGASIFNF